MSGGAAHATMMSRGATGRAHPLPWPLLLLPPLRLPLFILPLPLERQRRRSDHLSGLSSARPRGRGQACDFALSRTTEETARGCVSSKNGAARGCVTVDVRTREASEALSLLVTGLGSRIVGRCVGLCSSRGGGIGEGIAHKSGAVNL